MLVCFFLFYPFILVLEIFDNNSNKVVFAKKVNIGDFFTIRFIHSVERTPVEDIFLIDKNLKIVLKEKRFSSFGAGLPGELYGQEKFSLENGRFIIRDINREFSEILMFVGEVVANHTIIFNDNNDYQLASLGLAGKSVKINLKYYSLMFTLFNLLLKPIQIYII